MIYNYGSEELCKKFLFAVFIQSQVQEKPLPQDLITDRMAGLSGEQFSTELLRVIKEYNYKAKWKTFKNKNIWDLPFPFIIRYENTFLVMLRYSDDKLTAFNIDEKRIVTIPVKNISWDNVAFFMIPKFTLKELPQKFNLHWFFPVFWKFRRFFYEVMVASCVLQIFTLITPLFTQVIIDKVLVHKGVSTLDVLMAGLLVIGIFQMILGYLRTYIFTIMTNKVDVILGARLYDHIVGLPMRYFESRKVGETVARVKELETIRSFIGSSSLILLLDTAFCIIFIIAMYWYSPKLCLVALSMLPFMVLLNLIATPIFRERIQKMFEANAENQSFLVESVTGAATVKTLALERKFTRKWEDLLGTYVKKSFDVNNVANIANSIGGFLQQASTLLILWFGAHMVMDGALSVGQLVAFQMLSGQVFSPVLRLVNTWQQFQQVRVSIERIGDIMNIPKESGLQGEVSVIKQGEVYFDKVTFRYDPESEPAVKNISLKIAPGVMVGIVGPSGSGKSTLMKLLQRLYIPESGRILVDGTDISKLDPSAYRRQIGTVLQENYLFAGTVRDNISIARPNVTEDEIKMVSKMADADDFITSLKDGYNTVIGERGDSLSGGQRQKIAIARALLMDPKILVFDEATSALDALSEKEVLNTILRIRQNRTLLMISHRLASVRNADIILVMSNGRVVEYGTHEQLMDKKGLYRFMYEQQEGNHDR